MKSSRSPGWLAFLISSAAFFTTADPGKPFKGISILDCPEANQTSPIRMSSSTILFLPVTVNGNGPPADCGARYTLQCPQTIPSCCLGRTVEGCRNGLTRVRPAPNMNGLISLQHCMTAEYFRKADFPFRAGYSHGEREKHQDSF